MNQPPRCAPNSLAQGCRIFPVVTDGPFTETKEWLGGLTIVDVPDDEAARMWAGRVAEGCGWPQEVRRFKAGSLQAVVQGS